MKSTHAILDPTRSCTSRRPRARALSSTKKPAHSGHGRGGALLKAALLSGLIGAGSVQAAPDFSASPAPTPIPPPPLLAGFDAFLSLVQLPFVVAVVLLSATIVMCLLAVGVARRGRRQPREKAPLWLALYCVTGCRGERAALSFDFGRRGILEAHGTG